MDAIAQEQEKEILTNMLSTIHNICSNNRIKYFIAYGTLLGAIRHNGFIPWDDDIDIWVPIDQYDCFINTLSAETNYVIIDHRLNNKWLKCFSKVCEPNTIMKNTDGNDPALIPYGISIDVFPLFGCQKRKRWINEIIKSKKILARFNNYYLGQYKSVKYLSKRFYIEWLGITHRDIEFWKKRLVKLEQQYTMNNYCGSPISPYLEKDIHLSEDYLSGCVVSFEGLEVIAPKGWDNILTDLYGNYMELPPKEKRISNHNELAFFIDKSK